MASVGEDPETVAGVANDEAHGIDSIVLDGKCLDRQVLDSENLSGVKNFPCRPIDALFAHHMGGIAGGVNRHRIFFNEIFQAADVVAVLVGE